MLLGNEFVTTNKSFIVINNRVYTYKKKRKIVTTRRVLIGRHLRLIPGGAAKRPGLAYEVIKSFSRIYKACYFLFFFSFLDIDRRVKRVGMCIIPSNRELLYVNSRNKSSSSSSPRV